MSQHIGRAMAWLADRPAVASVIIGARSAGQLKDSLGAAGLHCPPGRPHNSTRQATRAQWTTHTARPVPSSEAGLSPPRSLNHHRRRLPRSLGLGPGQGGSPMRIGVIGAARITAEAPIQPARTVDEVEVAAVAARNLERAAAFAQVHGIPVARRGVRHVLGHSRRSATGPGRKSSGSHSGSHRWQISSDTGRHAQTVRPVQCPAGRCQATYRDASRVPSKLDRRGGRAALRIRCGAAGCCLARVAAARWCGLRPGSPGGGLIGRRRSVGAATMGAGCP